MRGRQIIKRIPRADAKIDGRGPNLLKYMKPTYATSKKDEHHRNLLCSYIILNSTMILSILTMSNDFQVNHY